MWFSPSGLDIVENGVTIITNRQGRNSGEAFVQFSSPEAATRALERDRDMMGHRWARLHRDLDSSLSVSPPSSTSGCRPCLQIHRGVSQQKWGRSQQEDEECRFRPEQRSASGPEAHRAEQQHHSQWAAVWQPVPVLATGCLKVVWSQKVQRDQSTVNVSHPFFSPLFHFQSDILFLHQLHKRRICTFFTLSATSGYY